MKHWPPLPNPADAPHTRRRIPAFHPVPVGGRKDGWTPGRQAAFIGFLAEKRSVEAACRTVSMGKESAYRLRKRPGAAGFAAAWDAALGKPHSAVDLASAKSTGLAAEYRSRMGLLQVVMERGRCVGTYWKKDNNALLQHLAQLDRAAGEGPGREGKPRCLEVPDASTPGVDFAGRAAAPPRLGEPLAAGAPDLSPVGDCV
jgi:hypothetical protein